MRINSNTQSSAEIRAERTSTPPTPNAASSRAAEVDKLSSDTVNLTSLAAQTLQMPPVRQDKVEALRRRVESGEYDIDPQGTAEAMLSE